MNLRKYISIKWEEVLVNHKASMEMIPKIYHQLISVRGYEYEVGSKKY